MEITFDLSNDFININKHGLSLAQASGVDWAAAITWSDPRRTCGEQRLACLGYVGNRLLHIVFVDRSQERRIISLRRANQKEIHRYAQA